MAALAGALEKRMREIFEVASVVGSLAHRSDQLSRDAAEQLARHPAPAGFGVVVEEMKRQAEDTKAAAVQVKSILGEMSKAVAATSTAARMGSCGLSTERRWRAGPERTSRSSQPRRRSRPRPPGEIALVVQQQDRGLDGMMKSMNGIYLATEETMASTQRVASEAQFLNDMAHRLNRSVRSAPTGASATAISRAGVARA